MINLHESMGPDWDRTVCIVCSLLFVCVCVIWFVCGLVMHGSRKLCQRGSTFVFFFVFRLVDEDLNTTISGPLSAC